MRDDDSNWFSKWEEELPSPEDLMPLSQTLITPHLAIAFDIPSTTSSFQQQPPPPPPPISISTPNSGDFDSGADEPARTLKRPRLVWTPQLHKRFVDAVAHLGIKNAVPKTIMQLMSVDGLTRENVASHLQKYRLYLKRMQQGLSSASAGDPATDHLFASSPLPAHFLPNSDHFLPYVPVPGLHAQLQPPYGQIGHFGSPRNGQFEHPLLLARQNVHRVGPVHNSVPSSYVDDLESANGRQVLTLFPTGDD